MPKCDQVISLSSVVERTTEHKRILFNELSVILKRETLDTGNDILDSFIVGEESVAILIDLLAEAIDLSAYEYGNKIDSLIEEAIYEKNDKGYFEVTDEVMFHNSEISFLLSSYHTRVKLENILALEFAKAHKVQVLDFFKVLQEKLKEAESLYDMSIEPMYLNVFPMLQ